MKKSKNKAPDQTSNNPPQQDKAVNAVTTPFDLAKHSLDHERKPGEIGFSFKR